MALFKKQGDNLSRAGHILESLATNSKVEPEKPEVVDTPEDVDTPEVIDTPEGTDVPEVIDTPPVNGDVIVEDGEGVATPTPPNTPPVVDETTTVEVTEDMIYGKLSEMLGRDVESLEDLAQKPELDPEVAQLLEWKEKTGLSLSDWSKYNKDFSKMSDLEVAREILAQENPGFTKEELEYELRGYIYNEDMDDEDDRMKKSIKLKKFAKTGRESLEAKRLELVSNKPEATLTQEQKDDLTFAQQMRQNSASVKKAQEEYNKAIAKASEGLDNIELNLSEDTKIKFNVPSEVKKGLPKMVSEMPHWYNEDGTYNHSNVVKDVAKIMNFNAIVEAVFKQGISVGQEGQIKRSANISIDGTPQLDTQKPKKGNVEDVVGNITGANRGNKLRFRTKNK